MTQNANDAPSEPPYWYENEAGERWVPPPCKPGYPVLVPEGFVYFICRGRRYKPNQPDGKLRKT